MNDRPVNANTIEQIDREAQELVSANQAFSKHEPENRRGRTVTAILTKEQKVMIAAMGAD